MALLLFCTYLLPIRGIVGVTVNEGKVLIFRSVPVHEILFDDNSLIIL